MTRAEIIKYYSMFTEDEVFYKSYYNAKKNDAALSDITKQFEVLRQHNRKVWLPELNMSGSHFLRERLFYNENNINVLKHDRYNPIFLHYHSFFEMIYVLCGQCVNTVEGKAVEMHSGDLFIIPPGVIHSMSVFDDESIILNIVIKESTFKETFLGTFQGDSCISLFFRKLYQAHEVDTLLFYHTDKNESLNSLMNLLLTDCIRDQEHNHYDSVPENILKTFFAYLSREIPEQIYIKDEKKGKLDLLEVLSYIQANHSTISFDDLANHFHISQSHLRKILKSELGESYVNILRKIRMEKAVTLLKETNMHVMDIAERIGYDSTDYFIKVFKKEFNATPTEFRKEKEKLLI